MVAAITGCATYQPAPLKVSDLVAPSAWPSDLPADTVAPTLLRLALARDPAVAAARASLLAAQKSQSAAKNLPSLSLSLTAEYSKDADARRPWLYGGAVGIPLDLGARRQTRITAADLAVVRARYALAEAIWSVRQRLYRALDDLTTADQDIALKAVLLAQRQAYQAVAQKRVTQGEDAQPLSAQAALDVSSARQGLALAQAQKSQAMIGLAHALDIAVDAVAGLHIPAATELPPPDEAHLAAMIEAMLYARSDVLLAVTDYDLAENELRAAVAAQYPDISLQPGYTWERGQVKLPVSLSLTLPPLDGNRAAIQSAQAARLATGKTLEASVKTTRAAAVQAAASYRSDVATAQTILETDLPAARDMAQHAQRLSKAGESDQAEALLAQINATQTQINLLQAQRTARSDRRTLEDALHQSFDATDTQILTDAITREAPP